MLPNPFGDCVAWFRIATMPAKAGAPTEVPPTGDSFHWRSRIHWYNLQRRIHWTCP